MRKTGEILEEYLRKKMSQVDLAKIIEVSPQYINNIIKNLKSPSENFLEKFYKIFDVSEKDKTDIKEYEEFRKLPKKFQEKLLDLKKSGENENNNEKVEEIQKISLLGKFDSNGFFRYDENNESISFIKIETNNELFAVKTEYINYIPVFYINDTLIFEKKNIIKNSELHGKICLIEYKDKIEIRKVEYIDEIIILKSLENTENMILLTKEKSSLLKVIGVLKVHLRIY